MGSKPCESNCYCGRHRFHPNRGHHPNGTFTHPKDCRCAVHARLARGGGRKPGWIGWVGADNPNWKGGPGYEWSGAGWTAARRKVWERDTVCQLCGGAPEPNRKLDVHHIVERRDGGTNNLENLIGYHRRCHIKVHRKTQRDRAVVSSGGP